MIKTIINKLKNLDKQVKSIMINGFKFLKNNVMKTGTWVTSVTR